MHLVQEQGILVMGAVNIIYKLNLTFNHIVDLRYILVVISEGEYTASLLIGTPVFLLYYFDMLQDFVMCRFLFLFLH